MPYVLAKVMASDDKAWDAEAQKVYEAIDAMGADGGAVLSGQVDLEFADGSQSEGSIYFKVLERLQKAKDRLILGQTSTSDSATSNRSTAAVHDLVRHDLRAADCRRLEMTVNQQIIEPLCRYQGIEPVPAISFDVVSWEIAKQLLEVVETADKAGLELVDVNELNRQAGLAFRRKQAPSPAASRVFRPGQPGDLDDDEEDDDDGQ
jgi:phage gp29-like protein